MVSFAAARLSRDASTSLVIPASTITTTPTASPAAPTRTSAAPTPRGTRWSLSQRTSGEATAAVTAAAMSGATIVWVSVSSQMSATTNSVTPTASHDDRPRSRSQRGASKSPLRSRGSNATEPSSSRSCDRLRDRRIAPDQVSAAMRRPSGGIPSASGRNPRV
jgi:hypothetical protein